MAAPLAYERPVLRLARLSGLAIAAAMILAIVLAVQWLGHWYAGRDAEQKAKLRTHQAAVSACVGAQPALAWDGCESLVREAELRRGE